MRNESAAGNVLEWTVMIGFCILLVRVDVFGFLTQLVAMVL